MKRFLSCGDMSRWKERQTEVNDEHRTMTVCVWGEWEDGSGGTKTGIHMPQTPRDCSTKTSFLLLNGPFSPDSPMNYVNDDCGILFFPWLAEGRKTKDRSERNSSSSCFFFSFSPAFLALPLNELSCRQCGPGFCTAAVQNG